jgi:squalene synthase HpnC
VSAGTLQAPEAGVAAPDVAASAAVMAKAARENFPVASRMLPRAIRRHRLAELDWAEAELDRAYEGRATTAVFRALSESLQTVDLPRQAFADLIEANRRDQTVTHYGTYEELLGYCRLSAEPVGRLVLRILAADDSRRVQLSDRVCSGLQLVEHWQDVAEDAARGRVYLPAEDLDRFGVAAAELTSGFASPAFRRLLAFEVHRARQLLAGGDHLVRSLQRFGRLAVSGFVAGGTTALDAIERAGFDVLGTHPRPGPGRLAVAGLRAFSGGRR